MIYLKRSVDFRRDITWVANELDEAKRRNTMLYAGEDVNGAIDAAVKAGLDREAAVFQAQEEIRRCNSSPINDTITSTQEVPWR